MVEFEDATSNDEVILKHLLFLSDTIARGMTLLHLPVQRHLGDLLDSFVVLLLFRRRVDICTTDRSNLVFTFAGWRNSAVRGCTVLVNEVTSVILISCSLLRATLASVKVFGSLSSW